MYSTVFEKSNLQFKMILRTLFLHCILFQNIIQSSAKTDTFDMKWIANSGYNPPLNSTISCNEAYYIKIFNIYGTTKPIWGREPIWGRVNGSNIINENCNHKRLCPVPVLPQWQRVFRQRWKLHIEYNCKATKVTTTSSSTLPSTVETTTKEEHVTVKISQPTKVTTTSTSTLPSTVETTTMEEHVTPIQVNITSSSTLPITAGPTTKEEHVTTKVSKQEDNSSAVTTTVAIAVSMTTLTVAGGVVVFIVLYRRCHRSEDVKGIYNNDPNVAKLKEVDISYTTESKSLGRKIRHALPHDLQSNSVDSGYTGMPIEDFRNIDNDAHKTVTHTTDVSVQNADDQYYTIKENANAEYNKITFKLKEIPEDPNYGHTVSSDDTMDKTYDHAQASAIPTNKVGFCDYSHINQNKAKEDANITRIICPKNANYSTTTPGDDGVENDSITDHNYWLLEKKDTDSTADNIDDERHCHSYFILSKKESQGSGELQNNELAILAGDAGRDSHNYFVLDKTDLTELKMGPNQTDEVDRRHRIKYSSNESGEHTYFENPLPLNEHGDNHQYQAIRERTPMSEIAVPADISHNYFVLEKEKV